MAIDRPGDESVEKQRATDAPPPPPPPDRPGDEDFPSRAESRAFAAAAVEKIRAEDTSDDRTDTSTPEAATEDQDTTETSEADRKEPESREGDADRTYDTDHGSQDDGPSHEPDKSAPGDGNSPAGESGAEAPSTIEEERIPTFDFTVDDGTRVRAYLDRDDEANELEKPDSPADPPSGEELLEIEEDDNSRVEKARRAIFKQGDDLHDAAESVDGMVKGLAAKPLPTGSAEVRTGPEIAPTPHQGIAGAEIFTAAVATAIVIGEVGDWVSDKIRTKRGV